MNARLILLLSCFAAATLSAAETPATALLVLDKTDNSLVIVDPSSLQPVGEYRPRGLRRGGVLGWNDRKFTVQPFQFPMHPFVLLRLPRRAGGA